MKKVLKNCAVATNHPITVLCGGTNNDETAVMKQVIRFDCVRWIKMPYLNEARCGAAAVFYQDDVFVFGGETFPVSKNATFSGGQVNPDSSNFSQTLEKFKKEWIVGQFPLKRSYFAAQVVGGKIYLIAGYTLTDSSSAVIGQNVRCKKVCNTVNVFDPVENTWENAG